MDQGYEDTRFESTVDRNLYFPICMNVLKDPVQCWRNQHYFCTPCITKHLKENSQTCPTCMEELTLETLGRPARILTDLLTDLKIFCDYAERGCREVIELAVLKTHVATCDFSPVKCSNDECSTVISKRDKELHENKVCGFRMVKCDYCGEAIQHVKYKTHSCQTRREIDEIKLNLTEVKGQLNHIRSTQEEMIKEMRSMMTYIKDNMTNSKQVTHSTCQTCTYSTNLDTIVIAGGRKTGYKELASVETFNWSSKIWTRQEKMNQCRAIAASFVYGNHMVVTGGFLVGFTKCCMEQTKISKATGQ